MTVNKDYLAYYTSGGGLYIRRFMKFPWKCWLFSERYLRCVQFGLWTTKRVESSERQGVHRADERRTDLSETESESWQIARQRRADIGNILAISLHQKTPFKDWLIDYGNFFKLFYLKCMVLVRNFGPTVFWPYRHLIWWWKFVIMSFGPPGNHLYLLACHLLADTMWITIGDRTTSLVKHILGN